MTRLLKSNWLLPVLGAGLYAAVTVLLLDPGKFAPRVSAAHSGQAGVTGPSWDFVNPELTRLVEELRAEKEALATRAGELEELEARLAAERAELNVVTQAVHRLQLEFDRHVVRVQKEEEANLRKLGKTYATMGPESAARIFKEMEDDQVVKIMLFMREKEIAALLESWAALGEAELQRVALITERLRTALHREFSEIP